jgi:hypothetical protein
MASWAEPINWKAGDLASTLSASGTIDMNQQIYGNMNWLGTTHDHSGGTRGNSTLGLIQYLDFIADGTGASAISPTAQRMWTAGTSGTSMWVANGTTSSFVAVNTTHSHAGF